MDGVFTPNYSIGTRLLTQLSTVTFLPIEVHLMTESPEISIDILDLKNIDTVTFHIETTKRPFHLIKKMRNMGVKVGVAINPSTPLSFIKPLLNYVDSITLMSVDPGFPGQEFIVETYEKLNILKELNISKEIDVQVDGAVGFSVIKKLDMDIINTIVVGTSSLYISNQELNRSAIELKNLVNNLNKNR